MTSPAPKRSWHGLLHSIERRAPRWLLVVLGLPLLVGGVLLTTRPLSSLSVIALLIGASAIVTGVAELVTAHRRPAALRFAAGIGWVLGGVLAIVWLGRSIELLPVAVCVLLVAGAVASLGGVTRGRLGERVLAGALAAAQLSFAVLALVWPDATLLVVAALFGVRVALHGLALLWRAVRGAPQAPRRLRAALPWTGAVLVLALAGTAVWGSTQLRRGLPVVDAFYSAPGAVPDEPGALLRDEAWGGIEPEGADVRRILYTTTDVHDDARLGSALVISPADAPDGPRPVILWDHGTTGIARTCAPSLSEHAFTEQTIPALQQALEAGWVVVATDYSGQGTDGAFPYLVGEGEARSGLDATRAAASMEGLELSPETVIWGHSQGGHAALWTGAVGPDYAPELNLRGVAAMAPAANPLAMAERIVSQPSSPLLAIIVAWVLVPYAETYPEIDLDDYVDPAGRVLVREISQRCGADPGMAVSLLDGLGIARDRPLFTGDLTAGVTGQRLDENIARGPWRMPLLVAWGDRDQVIAPELQHDHVAQLCAAGTDFSWSEIAGDDHLTIVQDSTFLDPLMQWTEDRFAGADAPAPDCG